MISTYIRKKILSITEATISHCSMYLVFSWLSIMLFLMSLLILTSRSFVWSPSSSSFFRGGLFIFSGRPHRILENPLMHICKLKGKCGNKVSDNIYDFVRASVSMSIFNSHIYIINISMYKKYSILIEEIWFHTLARWSLWQLCGWMTLKIINKNMNTPTLKL